MNALQARLADIGSQDRDLEVHPRGSPALTQRGINLMLAWTALKLWHPFEGRLLWEM